MAKRWIPRPTPRQIVDQAARNAVYERSLEDNAGWLAANTPVVPVAPEPYEPPSEAYRAYRRFEEMEEHNETPDRLGKTGEHEPKSIYSPAPASRFRFEQPNKRRSGDRNEPDCELPADLRRHATYIIEDASGRARGVVTINPFAKRIRVAGFGLTTKA
jgi:hypothetical protein